MSLQSVKKQPAWFVNNDVRQLTLALFNIFVKNKIIDDVDTLKLILSEDAVKKYWMKCFTHKSINSEYNNDAFEFYGDKVLGYTFSKYLRRRFSDNLDQASGTLLQNQYMSKYYQAQMSRRLGLLDLLVYDPEADPSVHVQEDTFEAFAGCTDIVLDEYLVEGAGSSGVYNLIVSLFQEVEINIEEVNRDDKTMLKEIYDKLNWGTPQYIVAASDRIDVGPYKVTIITSMGQVLGTGYGSEKEASFTAATQALAFLKEQGVDWETADAERIKKLRQRVPEYNYEYTRMEKAFERLKELAKKTRRAPPQEFKIVKVEERKTPQGFRYTYAIRVSFKDGNRVAWRNMKQLTGDDNDGTKIRLMREFADMYKIPKE